ncbi:MAG: CRISPR-associated endonuclease Cas1 [archaeon]
MMNHILLNGHGINVRVQDAKLIIKDGFYSLDEEPKDYIFNPKRIDVDSIIVYGQDGEVSIDAVRWLIKHNVQITFLDWNGKLLTTMLPPESVQVDTKFKQYETYNNFDRRLKLARSFIVGKFARTQEVLDYLKERYSEVDNDFEREKKELTFTKSLIDILQVEGRVASFYWKQLRKVIPKEYGFDSREFVKRPWGAGDQINCLLNYGYAILESECLRVINSVGLDAHIGFLHEKCMGKNSLAYDMQEPFRFVIDLAIIDAIENDIFEKKDFIRTETYTLKLRPSGAKKFIERIDAWLNYDTQKTLSRLIPSDASSDVKSRLSIRSLMLLKARELVKAIKKDGIPDFSEPQITLRRLDTQKVRDQILAIPYSKAKKLGFSKGTLYYMKQNAKADKPFKIYDSVKKKLDALS